jgi:hypothetical protein
MPSVPGHAGASWTKALTRLRDIGPEALGKPDITRLYLGGTVPAVNGAVATAD